MSEKVEWRYIDIKTFPKITNQEEMLILKPTKNGKYQITIANDCGNYDKIKDMELDIHLARILVNIFLNPYKTT